MRRVPEVIDVWFDSGSMPFAQHHAPFENHERYERGVPGRLRLRGARPDARLVLLADRGLDAAQRPRAVPQRRLPRAARRRATGRRCRSRAATSSRRGRSSTASAPTPSAGTSSPPSSPGTATASRSTRSARCVRLFLRQLWNVYAFFVLYANAGEAREGERHRPRPLGALAPGEHRRDGPRAPRRLRRDQRRAGDREFVEDLSNWYVRRSRRRFWDGERAAFETLRTALVTVAQLLAPVHPVHRRRDLRQPRRRAGERAPVRLPRPRASATSSSSSRWRPRARRCASGLAARRQGDVKVRQPLREAVIVADGRERAAIERLAEVVRDELNVVALRFVAAADELGTYTVKPNCRALGPALRQAHADARRRDRGARPGARSRARCATGGPSSSRSPAPTTSSAPTT